MHTYTRLALIVLIFTGCVFPGFTGCSTANPVGETPIAPQPEATDQVVTEIQAAPVPPGVEPEVFALLQAELARIVTDGATKNTAVPPTGGHNEITDLVLTGDDTSGWQLRWRYINTGDYNLDGMVSVSDLTPVGQYYESTAGDLDWDAAQQADGNNDGVVTVADITPIGQNYEAFIAGFNIYGAAAVEGPWELLGSIPRPDKPAEGTYLVTYSFPANTHATYRVVPYDSPGTEGAGSWPCALTPEPAEVTLGTDTTLTTQVIGTAGGTITAPLGSPIEGTSIVFPPGALPDGTDVVLGWNDGTVDLPVGALALPILNIEAGEVYEFGEPAQITVPFTGDESTLPFAVYIHPDGRLDAMQPLDIDHTADTFTFETFHASNIAVLFLRKTTGNELHFHLGFNPLEDDFWIANKQTRYTDGNCLGMAMYAKWYFDTISHSKTNELYPNFRSIIQSPPVVFCQDLIATRAQLSVHRYHKEYAPAIIGRGYVASHEYNYNALVNMIEITAKPQVLILDAPAAQHAVLVISVMLRPATPHLVEFWVYDPNRPGAKSIITFDLTTEQFQPYTSGTTTYTKFIHFGTGTVRYAELFSDILVDANQNFHGSADATIEITSHTDGQTVTTELADLSGYVHSGEALVAQLTIRNGNEVIELEPSVNGEFRVDVPMHEGTNFLSFGTKGYNEDNQLVILENSLMVSGFTLNAELPAPVQIAVTSHSNGQDVTTQQAQLTGTVTGGEIELDHLDVYNDAAGPFTGEIDGGGQFAVDVPMYYGENQLSFVVFGLVEGSEVEVPHNLSAPFVLDGVFEANAIDITMHMDPRLDLPSGNSMNLYVIDPTGDCAWSSDNETADGGHLTSDWDPAHDPPCYQQRFRLRYDDTVRWGEGYAVRIQWREDLRFDGTHIDPPAHYEVQIVLCSGYPTEEVINLSGDITGPHNWYNSECDATGPDWADVTVVTPAQP